MAISQQFSPPYILLLSSLALACNVKPEGSDAFSAGNDGSTTGLDSGGDGDGDGDGDGEPILDVGEGNGGGGGGDESSGCQNVDFLFLVDASPSMVDEQELLITASSQWIDTIQSELPQAASNYRVLVADLDDEWGEDQCDGCTNGCTYQDGSFTFDVPDYPCGHVPSACDSTLGAGVVFPAGADASNVDCGFPSGRRWLEASDAGVDTTFACAARVGASGSGDEQVARSLQGAVSAPMQGPGGCNEGFLRDDAILVVVIVTDEDEGDFIGNDLFVEEFGPALKEELVALKGGDEDGVVMVGLINDYGVDGGTCDAPPDLAIQGAVNLRSFISSFARHELGSVCATEFDTPLSGAIATISAACDEYAPVP